MSAHVDEVLRVLSATHDGDGLEPTDLKLVELVVNCTPAGLSELGRRRWTALVQSVDDGSYCRRWLHGQEHLRREHGGYVSWRGVTVEHYSFNDLDKERDAAQVLAAKCRLIESRGQRVTATTLNNLWDEMSAAGGMDHARYLVAWRVSRDGGWAHVLTVPAAEACTVAELRRKMLAYRQAVTAVTSAQHPNTTDTRVAIVCDAEGAKEVVSSMHHDQEWANRAWQSRLHDRSWLVVPERALLLADLPSREQVRLHFLAPFLQPFELPEVPDTSSFETGRRAHVPH